VKNAEEMLGLCCLKSKLSRLRAQSDAGSQDRSEIHADEGIPITKTHVSGLFTVSLVMAIIVGLVPAHAQTVSVLYTFGNANDPTNFLSPGTLVQGTNGNVYTTSTFGGVVGDYPTEGTVFSMSTTGALSSEYTFYADQSDLGPNGFSPYSGLTLGTDGNFYGTTIGGGVINGANAFGTVFKIDPQGNLTTLYTFTGGSDGGNPYGAPVEGIDGNFYGTTVCGGAQACGSGNTGTVYKITPSGSLTTLHQFDCTVGCLSVAPLVLATNGTFYGTAAGLGTDGSIFKVTPSGTFTTIYKFDAVHGEAPEAPLIQGSDGNFYGTTELGGANGYGVVFKVTAAGKLTVLHSFADNGTDGVEPVAGLVQGTDGNLYGVTEEGGTSAWGTIFSISPKGTGYSTLYSFDGTTGLIPEVALLQHTNGLFYGLTSGGGPFDLGTFYSFDASLKPFVRLVTTSGAVGATVGVLGQGFTGTTKVSFGGVSASYSVVSDTYLTAIVPSDAKTGAVTVVKKGSTLKSNTTFRVSPFLTSFEPPSGPVGTSVVITGVSLTQTSKVTFGGVKTTFTVNSDTQVTATVPTGAKTGEIAITTPGGTATSSGTFTVTP
jgi:uncharacterized repeat protein (TIGR03803 family)